MRKSIIFILFNLIVSVFEGDSIAQKKVIVKAVEFPNNHWEEGFWNGLCAASDGNVYLGTCGHGYSAVFYKYDPKIGEMTEIANISEFLGNYGKGVRIHGKIHTSIEEGPDGKLYFASGSMGSGPLEFDLRSWEGGHWFSYDLSSGKLEDLGLVTPNYGLFGIVVDPKRRLLYGSGSDAHLYSYDIEKRETRDLGRFANGPDATRIMVLDDQGNLYSARTGGRIWKYDVKEGRIRDLPVTLPFDPTAYPPTTSGDKTIIREAFWDEVNKKIYRINAQKSWLFEYDPQAGRHGTVRFLAELLPDDLPEVLKNTFYASLGFTLGKSRKVYYMPVTASLNEKFTRGVHFELQAGQRHLITYDLKTGKKEDLGPVFTEEGLIVGDFIHRPPTGGADVGPDGTVYFVSYVEEKNPEKVTFEFGHFKASLRLLIYRPG